LALQVERLPLARAGAPIRCPADRDFAKAQLSQNDYYPPHPGAVSYYKGDNVPLWPWFDDSDRPSRGGLVHRGRHPDGIHVIVCLVPTTTSDSFNGPNCRVENTGSNGSRDDREYPHARADPGCEGKLNRDSYASLNDFIEAHLQLAPLPTEPPTPTDGESKDPLKK
jgi:hypothetical protein